MEEHSPQLCRCLLLLSSLQLFQKQLLWLLEIWSRLLMDNLTPMHLPLVMCRLYHFRLTTMAWFYMRVDLMMMPCVNVLGTLLRFAYANEWQFSRCLRKANLFYMNSLTFMPWFYRIVRNWDSDIVVDMIIFAIRSCFDHIDHYIYYFKVEIDFVLHFLIRCRNIRYNDWIVTRHSLSFCFTSSTRTGLYCFVVNLTKL